MEWAWAGAGDSPRGRAEPGPGVASPPMPPRPSAPVLRGSRRGPPRVRGWAMGGGRWGGGAGPSGRGTGSSYRGPVPPVSCPSGWPAVAIGVAVPPWRRTRSARRRFTAAGAGACGAILVQQAGSPSCGGGRGPSHHWPCVAVPGGGPWWSARGSVPRWWARARIGLYLSVARAYRRSAGRARSPAIPPRHAWRAPPRVPCAPGGQVCLGSLPRAQSPTHTAVRRFARRAAAASRWASPRP